MLTLAIASPIVRRIVDRFGVQQSALFYVVAASLCYVLLASSLRNLGGYHAIHAGIAGLGAAAAAVAYRRIIARHFVDARGLALSIASLGPSIAAAFAPLLVGVAIAAWGWRGGYLLLAAMIPALLLLRRELSAASGQAHLASTTGSAVSALSRRRFVHFLATFGFFSLGVGGLIVHSVPMLPYARVAVADAARLAGLLGVAVTVGRFIGGFLADRYFAPFILAGVALAAAMGCYSLAAFVIGDARVAALAVGFSLAAEADHMGYVVSHYVDRDCYGRTFGCIYVVFIIGIDMSSTILSLSIERPESYTPGLMGCATLLWVAASLFAPIMSTLDVARRTSNHIDTGRPCRSDGASEIQHQCRRRNRYPTS